MTTKTIKWEIVAFSSGKREQLCDTHEQAKSLLPLLVVEGIDRYRIQEVTIIETHEQELKIKDIH